MQKKMVARQYTTMQFMLEGFFFSPSIQESSIFQTSQSSSIRAGLASRFAGCTVVKRPTNERLTRAVLEALVGWMLKQVCASQ